MGVFRRKVTKGTDKPRRGHFGSSPEFTDSSTGAKKPPQRLLKRRKPKL